MDISCWTGRPRIAAGAVRGLFAAETSFNMKIVVRNVRAVGAVATERRRAEDFEQTTVEHREGLWPAAVGADLAPDHLAGLCPVDARVVALDLAAVRGRGVVLLARLGPLVQDTHQQLCAK